MTQVVKRGMMTKLIEDLELVVLKSPVNAKNVSVNAEDLLILIEYARQCEAVILMNDGDLRTARQLLT
jgi:hypothetical protein